MYKKIVAACLLGLGGIVPAWADSAAQDAVEHFVRDVQSFDAAFVQNYSDETSDTNTRQSGHFWLQRPGRFRWAYTEPYQQLMVCDGKNIWLYDPDLKQVTVRPEAGAITGTPAELLANRGELSSGYEIKDLGDENGELGAQLVPRSSESDFASIDLWFKSGIPTRMVFHDRLGGVSTITFSDARVNQPIDASLLAFKKPDGVEVVGSPAE